MSDERKLILQMVKEGRMEIEEAEKLLEALGSPKAQSNADPSNSQESIFQQAAQQAGPKVEQFMSSLSSMFGSVAGNVGPAIEQKLGNIFQGVSNFTNSYNHTLKDEEKIISDDTITKVNLENLFGNITITGHDAEDIILESEKLTDAKTDEQAAQYSEACKAQWSVNNGELTITPEASDYLKAGKVILNLKLKLPHDLALNLTTQIKDIRVNQYKASEQTCQLKTNSGDIYLQEVDVKHLDIQTSSGTFKGQKNRTNELNLKTTSGDIKFEGTFDKGKLSTTSGYTELECSIMEQLQVEAVSSDILLRSTNSPGKIELNSTSGDIEFYGDVKSEVSLSSSSGDLEGDILLSDSGAMTLTTNSGDIDFGLGLESNCTLEANTKSGEIECRKELSQSEWKEHSFKGQVGNGQGFLKMQTTSGDILII